MAIFKTFLQYFLHPGKSLRKRILLKQLDGCIAGKATEKILEVLLELMSIMFLIDKSYRKNIIGFNGKYRIQDQTGAVDVSFQFASNEMTWQKAEIPNPNIAVNFKDPESICSFLFSANPDILNFVLHNKVSYAGNLNYLFKFAYMAKHLQLEFLG
jgi:hypothetical protein